MNVRVEIKLNTSPQEKHRQEMRRAASDMTNNLNSIKIYTQPPVTLIAEFTMKTTAQYKVVDEIGREFVCFMENYSDLTISFPDSSEKKQKRKPKESLEKAIERFVTNAEQIFAVSDIVLSIPPDLRKSRNLQAKIEEILHSNSWVFYDSTFEDYHPRVSHFHKANFLIIPQQEEIEKKIPEFDSKKP